MDNRISVLPVTCCVYMPASAALAKEFDQKSQFLAHLIRSSGPYEPTEAMLAREFQESSMPSVLEPGSESDPTPYLPSQGSLTKELK